MGFGWLAAVLCIVIVYLVIMVLMWANRAYRVGWRDGYKIGKRDRKLDDKDELVMLNLFDEEDDLK